MVVIKQDADNSSNITIMIIQTIVLFLYLRHHRTFIHVIHLVHTILEHCNLFMILCLIFY